MFLSSGDDYVGELLEWHQWCQGPFRGSRGKVGFLSRCRSGKGSHLMLRGESLGFSQVAAGNLGFLSSCDWNLRDPLVWPQESPVSMRVARGLSGFLSSRCRGLRPRLESRPEPEDSSPVLTWILWDFWSLPRGVSPRLEWGHARALSSRAVAAVSRFPSHGSRDLWLSLEAFPRGFPTMLSHMPP